MRIDDGRVIPTFIQQALTGNDLTVYGDGSQTRSLCYISDLIDGFQRLLQSDLQEPVNLGNPDERTILELAEVILELTGSASDITHEPLPPDDPKVRRPDITKANRQLDWEPDVPLREGLNRSIEYFESVLE